MVFSDAMGLSDLWQGQQTLRFMGHKQAACVFPRHKSHIIMDADVEIGRNGGRDISHLRPRKLDLVCKCISA